VVYLKSDIKQLLKRTSRDNKRPLLQNTDPEVVLTELLEKRGPLYEAVADMVIDTAELSINDIIAQIMSIEQ
jgi:shikimate kinase